MSALGSTCPGCRQVREHYAPDVIVAFCDDEPVLSTYSFTCPSCGPQSVLATPNGIALLARAGAVVHHWRKMPAPVQAPPLTYDDVLEFVLQLHSDEVIAAEVARLVTS